MRFTGSGQCGGFDSTCIGGSFVGCWRPAWRGNRLAVEADVAGAASSRDAVAQGLPALIFSIGITGHRSLADDPDLAEAVGGSIGRVLDGISADADRLPAQGADGRPTQAGLPQPASSGASLPTRR